MRRIRSEVLRRIGSSGIIAVIRAKTPEKALELARAVKAGGIDVIEITFTVPRAAEVIRQLKEGAPEAPGGPAGREATGAAGGPPAGVSAVGAPAAGASAAGAPAEGGWDSGLIVGAGTVLSADHASLALEAEADFIVSPGLDLSVVRAAVVAETVVMPGAMTVTEIMTALRAGADAVKLFPAGALGPGFIKAVHGPLPEVRFVPTGGVSLANVGEWFEAGCFAVGVGGELTGAGDPAAVTEAARAFVARVRSARRAKG